MKQKPTSHRRAFGPLLAAVALPFAPAVAQDSSTVPQAPVVEVAPPAPAPAPAPAPIIVPPAAPVAAAPAPVTAPEPAPAAEPAAAEERATQSRASAEPTRRTAARRASPLRTAPAPIATPDQAPAATTAPLAAQSSTESAPAETRAEPAPAAVTPAPVATDTPVAQDQPSRSAIWPWLLGALLLIVGAASLLRRRRRADAVFDDDYVEDPVFSAPPVMGTQVADTNYIAAAGPFAPVLPAAAPIETGRPAIALQMRPVRAGVNQEDAIVEFELTVDNQGSAPARDLRISTWMFAAGHSSAAERALIEPGEGAELPEVTIQSGHAKRIESAVTLPTAGLAEDAVLPVVVAEAHYRLPDGSEESTTASFEVGVPIGEELAHFSLDNPSGLHEDVVARPHRETVTH